MNHVVVDESDALSLIIDCKFEMKVDPKGHKQEGVYSRHARSKCPIASPISLLIPPLFEIFLASPPFRATSSFFVCEIAVLTSLDSYG